VDNSLHEGTLGPNTIKMPLKYPYLSILYIRQWAF
jgi:hypothetical protein